MNLKREINWKIDKPFNFNKARLASVSGKVNMYLPPIANRIAKKKLIRLLLKVSNL